MSLIRRLPNVINGACLQLHKISPIGISKSKLSPFSLPISTFSSLTLNNSLSCMCACYLSKTRKLDNGTFLRSGYNLDVTAGVLIPVCFYATDKKSELPDKRLGTPQKKIVQFDYSGDLEKLKDPVKEETLFGFNQMKYLKAESEEIQRICTLEFASGPQRLAHEKIKLQDYLTEVCGPFNVFEKRIARETVHVRHLIKHCLTYKKDIKSKVILVEKIAKRKKMLKKLRKIDYERFIWLLKLLKIKYVPEPKYQERVATRASSMRRKAKEEASLIRKRKMEEAKRQIGKEYNQFQKRREDILADIAKDIEEYGFNKKQLIDAALRDLRRKENEERKIKQLERKKKANILPKGNERKM